MDSKKQIFSIQSIGIDEKVDHPSSKECFTAYLDILGFRSILVNKGEDELAQIYHEALAISRSVQNSKTLEAWMEIPMEYAHDVGNPGSEEMFAQPRIIEQINNYPHIEKVVAFSDSIFVFSDDCSADSLGDMADYCNTLFQIFLSKRLPLSGVIAKGNSIVWSDSDIYLGKGVVAAYEMEQVLSFIGVVCHMNVGEHSRLSESIEIARKTGGPIKLCVPRPLLGTRAELKVTKVELWTIFKDLHQNAVNLSTDIFMKYESSKNIFREMIGDD